VFAGVFGILSFTFDVARQAGVGENVAMVAVGAGVGLLAALSGASLGTWLCIATGAIIFTGTLVGVPSDPKYFLTVLFFFALPFLNGVLDWISLSVSRWFGRAIIADSGARASLAITLGIGLLDLLAAVAFAFAVAWLLALGVEASGLPFLDLSLDLEAYVRQSAEAPWTLGIWATFMVLSTLVPTALHFVLAVGAIFVAWSGNPLNRLVARRLTTGNEADYLFPQLYLTFAWMLPAFLVPAVLIWALAQLTQLFTFTLGPVETLPDLLRNTALHGIATARGIFGPVP
jgi:hypothetical protein